jgi:hypothetical protein
MINHRIGDLGSDKRKYNATNSLEGANFGQMTMNENVDFNILLMGSSDGIAYFPKSFITISLYFRVFFLEGIAVEGEGLLDLLRNSRFNKAKNNSNWSIYLHQMQHRAEIQRYSCGQHCSP